MRDHMRLAIGQAGRLKRFVSVVAQFPRIG
jgi:hypothetical protein